VSGAGAPHTAVEAQGLLVGLASASWHPAIMDGLLDGARRALADSGVTDVVEVQVPGTFELPVAAARLAGTGVDAVIALGVVIQGQTPHFDYICQGATAGLTEVAVRSGVPVGFGVLTCDNEGQARDRAGLDGSRENKGYEAAVAALTTAVALRRLAAVPTSLAP